jgi:hypothetical protein
LSSLFFVSAFAGSVTVTDNSTYTTLKMQVSKKLNGSVTKVSGFVSANVTKPEVVPEPVPLKTTEENKLKKTLAFLGMVMSLLGLWGVVKNLLVAVQTMGRSEAMSLKVVSQVAVGIILLVLLLYSMKVLVAGVGVGSLVEVFE